MSHTGRDGQQGVLGTGSEDSGEGWAARGAGRWHLQPVSEGELAMCLGADPARAQLLVLGGDMWHAPGREMSLLPSAAALVRLPPSGVKQELLR